MTAILFATHREAAPFLELSGHRLLRAGPPAVFGLPAACRMLTLVSGMGPAAAKAAARCAVEEHGARRLVNAGICGALRTGPPWLPGAVFAVKRARTADGRGTAPSPAVDCDWRRWPSLPTADLVTRPSPLFDARLRRKLARWGMLVDMEGGAIAAMARALGVPCTLIKGITDGAEAGGRDELHRRLESVSRRIAEVLAAGLLSRETPCHV